MEPANTNWNQSYVMDPMQNSVFPRIEPQDLARSNAVCKTWNMMISNDEQFKEILKIASKIANNIRLPLSQITNEFILNNAINSQSELVNLIEKFVGEFNLPNVNENWTFTFHNLNTGAILFWMGFNAEIERDNYQEGAQKNVVLFTQKQITFIGHLCTDPGTSSTSKSGCRISKVSRHTSLVSGFLFTNLKYDNISSENSVDIMDADKILMTIYNTGSQLLDRFQNQTHNI